MHINLGRRLLVHHYYITNFSDTCVGVRRCLKKYMHITLFKTKCISLEWEIIKLKISDSLPYIYHIRNLVKIGLGGFEKKTVTQDDGRQPIATVYMYVSWVTKATSKYQISCEMPIQHLSVTVDYNSELFMIVRLCFCRQNSLNWQGNVNEYVSFFK